MISRPHFQKLVERARNVAPLHTAFVYPCDADALQTAISAQFASYVAPVLVGPETRIADAATHAGVDISRLEIVNTADEPQAAAECAVALARTGAVDALVKGSLYPEDLMRAVAAPDSGLRTGRRLTHAFLLDIPSWPRALVLSDAMLNITPNLAAKRDIVLNAIQFAQALGMVTPAVAILAGVEGVTHAMPSTIEANALTKMAAQGMMPGATVAGPITMDAALSIKAAQAQGVQSRLAGSADVLIVPNLEAGALVVRTLTAMFDALAAGIVLGATVPIVLSSRYDPIDVRTASCVLAMLVHGRTAGREGTPARTATGAEA